MADGLPDIKPPDLAQPFAMPGTTKATQVVETEVKLSLRQRVHTARSRPVIFRAREAMRMSKAHAVGRGDATGA